jgi:4-diphosphocytidyl-2-C-methyl-D-erythritol kinase
MRLRTLAPGKVNLCLFVGPTRADARHEVLTLLESVSLADQVSVVTGGVSDEVRCPGVRGPNLADDALRALRSRGWAAPPVLVEIDKRVPVAGGMAGGSADAAAVLRSALMLAEPAPGVVAEIATSLGSDVPSQLAPGLLRGTGAGDLVEALEPLAAHAFVVVPLPFALSSADVYSEADRLGLPRDAGDLDARAQALAGAIAPGARLPDELLVNDLQQAAIALCPAVGEALSDVRAAGAETAFVSGSGPTVVGLFWGAEADQSAAAAALELSARYPAVVPARPVGAEFGMPQPA